MTNGSDIPGAIVGHRTLVAIFGRWPSFHDAEVVSIHLERDEGQPLTGPVCTVVIIPKGEPSAPTSEPVVTLRFYDVSDLRLAAFNHQNPVLGLTISPCDVAHKSHPLPSHVFDVTFRGVHEEAFSAAFTCSRIEVVSVRPLS